MGKYTNETNEDLLTYYQNACFSLCHVKTAKQEQAIDKKLAAMEKEILRRMESAKTERVDVKY